MHAKDETDAPDETTALLNPTNSRSSPPSSPQPQSDPLLSSDDEEDDVDEGDEEEDEFTDEEYQEEDDEESDPSFLVKVWNHLKNLFFIVANVENLWDAEMGPVLSSSPQLLVRRKIVFFWFFVLACSYATERSTFKLLVDRAGPFRLFAVEMVTGTHIILLGSITIITHLVSRKSTSHRQKHGLGISAANVGIMAAMDTVSLLIVFLTGSRVTPTLTVILVQFTLPLSAFLSQFLRPGSLRNCRNVSIHDESSQSNFGRSVSADQLNNTNGMTEPPVDLRGDTVAGAGGLSQTHIWGSLIILLAVLLALIPAVYALIDPLAFYYADALPLRTAINTLLYASSSIPGAASMLYKEHVFQQYKQPVRQDYLNLLLSVFQLVIASIMSPLLFGLQGLGVIRNNMEGLYPSSDYNENVQDGFRCFFGLLSDDDQQTKYPEEARCSGTIEIVLLHVLSITLVGLSVDKIINAGATKVMYRGISAGIIVSVILMHLYDYSMPDFNYGPKIDMLNLGCVILLILGSEVYHRVSLQDSSFETDYTSVGNIYDA